MVPRSAPVPSMSRGSAADRKRIDRSRWQTPISDALVTAGILHAYSVVSARILRAADARRAPLFRVLDGTANVGGSTWGFIELKSAWISQPKIVISFVTWGVYMALVFLRTVAGWRGRKAAIMTITVSGFAAITWAAHARLGNLLFKS